MTIQSVFKTGRKFKRSEWSNYGTLQYQGSAILFKSNEGFMTVYKGLSLDDIMADDWVIKE